MQVSSQSAQNETETLRHVGFEHRGKRLYYVSSPQLEEECPQILNLIEYRRYTETAYKEHGLKLEDSTSDFALIQTANSKQNYLFEEFSRLNTHLRDTPGSLVRAYQHFTAEHKARSGKSNSVPAL